MRSLLPSNPPTNDSLNKILNAIFLANTALFTRRLKFSDTKQDTGKGQTVEAFVKLLEAQAELGNTHLIMFDKHMMFHILTGVQDKGMLTEWRSIENHTMPEMKCIMKIYMNGKATRNCPKKSASAAKAGEKNNRGCSLSRGRMSIPDVRKGLCMRCAKPNHIKSKCNTNREDVKWGSCNRMGHISNVCLDTYDTTRRPRRAPASPPGRSRPYGVRTYTTVPAPQAKQPLPPDPPSSDDDDIQASVARVRAAPAGPRQTPPIRLRIRMIGRLSFDFSSTLDTGATNTAISADIIARRSLFTRHSFIKLYSTKEGDGEQQGHHLFRRRHLRRWTLRTQSAHRRPGQLRPLKQDPHLLTSRSERARGHPAGFRNVKSTILSPSPPSDDRIVDPRIVDPRIVDPRMVDPKES